jgi:hypothetical protein
MGPPYIEVNQHLGAAKPPINQLSPCFRLDLPCAPVLLFILNVFFILFIYLIQFQLTGIHVASGNNTSLLSLPMTLIGLWGYTPRAVVRLSSPLSLRSFKEHFVITPLQPLTTTYNHPQLPS